MASGRYRYLHSVVGAVSGAADQEAFIGWTVRLCEAHASFTLSVTRSRSNDVKRIATAWPTGALIARKQFCSDWSSFVASKSKAPAWKVAREEGPNTFASSMLSSSESDQRRGTLPGDEDANMLVQVAAAGWKQHTRAAAT